MVALWRTKAQGSICSSELGTLILHHQRRDLCQKLSEVSSHAKFHILNIRISRRSLEWNLKAPENLHGWDGLGSGSIIFRSSCLWIREPWHGHYLWCCGRLQFSLEAGICFYRCGTWGSLWGIFRNAFLQRPQQVEESKTSLLQHDQTRIDLQTEYLWSLGLVQNLLETVSGSVEAIWARRKSCRRPGWCTIQSYDKKWPQSNQSWVLKKRYTSVSPLP